MFKLYSLIIVLMVLVILTLSDLRDLRLLQCLSWPVLVSVSHVSCLYVPDVSPVTVLSLCVLSLGFFCVFPVLF